MYALDAKNGCHQDADILSDEEYHTHPINRDGDETVTRAARAEAVMSWASLLALMRSATGGSGQTSQLAVLVGAACLVVVIAIASAILTLDNRAAGTEVLQAQRVTTDVARLMILLQRAETSQRGYFLTANRDYLDLFKESVGKIYPTLETITTATKGNAAQRQELLTLRTVIAAKLSEMNHTITLFDAPVWAEHDLVLVEGRWYGKQAMIHWSEHDDEDVEG